MRPRLHALGVAVCAVVLALAACTTGPESRNASGPPQGTSTTNTPDTAGTPSGAAEDGDGSGEPAITVRVAGGAWVVRGTGFVGGNQYLVQCTGGTTAGASALDECDMSTSEQVAADKRGRISATRQVRAFVNVGSVSEVDCTGDPCALAVADLSDRVLAAAPAPLPGGAEPPDAPTIELSEQKLGAHKGSVTVTGTGYAQGATVRIAQCATASGGGVDANNCLYDDGKRTVADRAGSVVTRLPVQREIELVGGGVTDCAEAGACVIANAATDGGRMARADLLWE